MAHVTQDDSIHTHAICETELDKYYFPKKASTVGTAGGVFYFLIITLLVPIISMVLTAFIVRSLRKNIHIRITKKANHHNLAGEVLTGVFVTFYIVGCDAAAVYYSYSGKNELSETHKLKLSLNFVTTIVMLACDSVICLTTTLVMLFYVCCWNLHIETKRRRNCNRANRAIGCVLKFLHRIHKISFTVVFGTAKPDTMWEGGKKKASCVDNSSFPSLASLCD
jgi:ribosomal protein L31E